MKSTVQILAASTGFVIYAAMGAAAFAQPAKAVSPPGPGPHAHHHESQAERADRLRAILQLRPAQEPALQTYVAAIDSMHKDAGSRATATPPRTTPERLDHMQQMMAQHQGAMTAFIGATRKFYDQLDPAQKRAFDALPVRMKHHGPGMMFMGGDRMIKALPPGGPSPKGPPPAPAR